MTPNISIQHRNWPRNRSGAILTVDLKALVANYRFVKEFIGPVHCAAVLKDDAYGVGVDYVGPALYKAGIRDFFVAYAYEGICLRQLLGPDCTISVLHEPHETTPSFWRRHKLRPVINDLKILRRMHNDAIEQNVSLDVAIQIDSGLSRLGLSLDDMEAAGKIFSSSPLTCSLVISHLACASMPENVSNKEQLSRFRQALTYLPQNCTKSLAATDGIFLGKDYHFDLVRPGAIFYGITPKSKPEVAHYLKPVIKLQAKVLQIHELKVGEGVGYDLTWRAKHPARIAIICAGYGDGLYWSARNGRAWYQGYELPFIGRMSMDCLAVDITHVPQNLIQPYVYVDLLNERYDINKAAQQCSCTTYEILTSLGQRYCRNYLLA